MAFCNKKVVQASYHQGDIIRYARDSAGKQCMANVYLPWFLHQLNELVFGNLLILIMYWNRGIKISKKVCENEKKAWILAVDGLLLNFPLEGTVSARKLAHGSLLFAEKNNFFENYRHYSESKRENGTILTCGG